MVQRRAARWVLSRYHPQDSVTNMIETLGWDTLEHKRAVARVLLLYKIINGRVAIDPGGPGGLCARLAQLVRSLTANQEVRGPIPGLVEGRTLGDLLSLHHPWTGMLSRWSSLSTFYPGT